MDLPLDKLKLLSAFMRDEGLARVEVEGDRVVMVRSTEAMVASPETEDEKQERELAEKNRPTSPWNDPVTFGGVEVTIEREDSGS